jgi:hypothetical protein
MTSPDRPAAAGLTEPLLAFFAATALASALFWIGRSVLLLGENLHGAIALIFLFAPRVASSLSKQPFDYREAGLRLDPLGSNAAVLGLALAVAWPLFFAAFLVFYGGLCSLVSSPTFGYWADWMAGSCGRWAGWGGVSFRLPPGGWSALGLLAITQGSWSRCPRRCSFADTSTAGWRNAGPPPVGSWARRWAARCW